MNDTQMTIAGNLVGEPTMHTTDGGLKVTTFRVASTPRHMDRSSGQWKDATTLYVTVKAWRALAENVQGSLHKGDPVVVVGRFQQREYTREEQLRTAYELDASFVGHDLNRGVSRFDRVRRNPWVEVERDADGVPADVTGHYMNYTDGTDGPDGPDEVDPRTGEVVNTRTGEVRELLTAG